MRNVRRDDDHDRRQPGVSDPELRYTPSGQAVAKFRVASTPRAFDQASNEWKDQPSLFLDVNVWRQAGENVAESLQRGMRVIVTGRLEQRSYEAKDGTKRTVYEITADEVGPSLKNASAKVTKAERRTEASRPTTRLPTRGRPGLRLLVGTPVLMGATDRRRRHHEPCQNA